MKEYKLFVQRIGLIGITNILVGLAGIILLPILTQNISVDDYGVWVQFNTTIGLIPLIATLGLPYAMMRFLPTEDSQNKIRNEFYSIFFIIGLVSLILSVIIFTLSEQISLLLFNGIGSISILLALTTIVACLFYLTLSFFRTFQQMKAYCLFTLLQVYGTLFFVAYLATLSYSITELIMAYFIVQIIIFLASFIFIIKKIGISFPKFTDLRKYFSFGIPTLPGNVSSWIVNLSDRYVIGILLGTAFVGYYSPGYTIGTIISMIVAPFTVILTPLLSSYYDKNQIEDVIIILRYSLKYFLLIAIPSVFVLSLLSKPLLLILTTEEIANNGYLITPIVATSAFFLGIYGIISHVLVLEKKTKIIGFLWTAAAIINLFLNILFIPIYGIIAAAIMTLISYGFVCAVSWLYSLKYLDMEFDVKFTIKSIFSSIIMGLIIIIVNPTGIIDIVLVLVVSGLIYMLSLLLLKGIDKKEIQFFKEMIIK